MIENVVVKLREIVSIDGLLLDEKVKASYEKEWRNRYSNPSLGVIFPKNVSQIQQILGICQEYQIGVIPQGGNTSMCAGSIPTDSPKPQLIINLSKLNHILEFDIANNSVTVEAGCTLHQIQEHARENNLYFPLSIGSEGSCQIGGNIATNAGGIHVIKYGMMRDLVLGLEVVLANGQIVNQLKELKKNNVNFDLKQLFIGSEGTLGIISKATLKLFPQIKKYFTGLIGLQDIGQAISLLNHLKKDYSVCAFEIINLLTQQIYNLHFKENSLPIQDNWLILFELEIGDNFDIEKITDLFEKQKIDLNLVILASTDGERQKLWQFRENIPLAEKLSGFAVKHDIALPLSKIEDFIISNQKNIQKKYPDAQIITFGHLGDGNLHYNIQFNQRNYKELQEIENDINSIVYKDVDVYNGTFSAEHGIGYIKKSWMAKYYDPVSYAIAQSIKQLLDPNNILNPGKIFNERE